MNGIFLLLPLLLALFSTSPAIAYDLGKPDDIEFALTDNPDKLARWLEQEMPKLDRDKQFPLWIRAQAAYLRTDTFNDYRGDPKDLAYGEREAKVRGFYREYLQIKRYKLARLIESNAVSFEVGKQGYLDLIAEAKQLKQKGVEYRLATDLAWSMMDLGNTKEAISRLMEIPKVNPPGSGISFYEWMEIIQDVVTSIPTGSNWDRPLTMYRDILDNLEGTRPRYLLATTKANIAVKMITNKMHAPDFDPEQLLNDAIQMAAEIESNFLIGTCRSALGLHYQNIGRLQDALQQYQKAMSYIEKFNQPLWVADTQKKLAHVLIQMKRFKEAQSLVEKSQKFFTKEYRNDHFQLLQSQHKILAGQQKFKEGIAVLQEQLKFYRENLAANEQTEINSRLVGIEIDVEQERSRALELEAASKHRKALIEEQLQQDTEQRHKSLDLFIRGVLVLLILIGVLFIWAHSLRKKNELVNLHIRENLLLRFVPPALAHAIATGERRIEQETQRFDITVVFARIVRFEDIVQKMGPAALADALSPFMEAMSEVVFAHGGTIDKFNRGTLMLLFGAPVPMSDESQVGAATRCAEAMLMRLDEMQENGDLPHGIRLQLAIGIHHGPALVGFFGGAQRTDYTAIGATVNMASRIEGLAAPGDVVVSEITALKLKDEEYRLMGHFQLKGIEEDQALYVWIRQGEQEAVS